MITLLYKALYYCLFCKPSPTLPSQGGSLLPMSCSRIHTVRLIKQDYKNIVNNGWPSKTLRDEVKVKLDGEVRHYKSTGSRP